MPVYVVETLFDNGSLYLSIGTPMDYDIENVVSTKLVTENLSSLAQWKDVGTIRRYLETWDLDEAAKTIISALCQKYGAREDTEWLRVRKQEVSYSV